MCDKHNKCRESNPLEGKYVNYFEVGHNAFEFVLDFGQSYAGNQEPQLHTRIITSPAYAKSFLETLGEPILPPSTPGWRRAVVNWRDGPILNNPLGPLPSAL